MSTEETKEQKQERVPTPPSPTRRTFQVWIVCGSAEVGVAAAEEGETAAEPKREKAGVLVALSPKEWKDGESGLRRKASGLVAKTLGGEDSGEVADEISTSEPPKDTFDGVEIGEDED